MAISIVSSAPSGLPGMASNAGATTGDLGGGFDFASLLDAQGAALSGEDLLAALSRGGLAGLGADNSGDGELNAEAGEATAADAWAALLQSDPNLLPTWATAAVALAQTPEASTGTHEEISLDFTVDRDIEADLASLMDATTLPTDAASPLGAQGDLSAAQRFFTFPTDNFLSGQNAAALSTLSPLAENSARLAPIGTGTEGRTGNSTDHSAALFSQSLSDARSAFENLNPDTANFAALPEQTENTALLAPTTQGTQSSSTANSSTGAAQSTLNTPLGDNRWGQDLGDKVVWLARNDQQLAHIEINPPELGPVHIRLNLQGDQATAQFAAASMETRQAIEDAMPRLRDMLASSGISLGEANVGAQLPQQQRENNPAFAQNPRNPGQATGETAILAGDAAASPQSVPRPVLQGRGMVDLFA